MPVPSLSQEELASAVAEGGRPPGELAVRMAVGGKSIGDGGGVADGVGVALGLLVADGFTDGVPERDGDGCDAVVAGIGAAVGFGEALGEGLGSG